jgi:hypothetical protein
MTRRITMPRKRDQQGKKKVVAKNPTFELTHGQRMAAAKTYYAPALAYLDTFSGTVPVKVLRVIKEGHGWIAAGEKQGLLEVQVTAARRGYKKGEILQERASDVVPRKHVRRRKYSSTILTNYIWATGKKNPKRAPRSTKKNPAPDRLRSLSKLTRV